MLLTFLCIKLSRCQIYIFGNGWGLKPEKKKETKKYAESQLLKNQKAVSETETLVVAQKSPSPPPALDID